MGQHVQNPDGSYSQQTVLTGRNVENQLEALAATYRKDLNSLGILRVFLESVLSSDSDSVALGGPLASTLARKPRALNKILVSNLTIPATGDVALPIALFDMKAHIVITSLQIKTTVAAPLLTFWRYIGDTLDPLHIITESGSKHMLAVQHGGFTNINTKHNTHGLFDVKSVDAATNTWEVSLRPGVRAEFPDGLLIKAENETAVTYKVDAQVLYLEMP